MGVKDKLIGIAKIAAGFIPGAGGIVSGAFDLLETRGMTPETKSELLKLREENKQELAKLESDERSRIAEASANVIIAEATSQSWLPRNVRPLFILMGTLLVFFNFGIPLWEQLFSDCIPLIPNLLPDQTTKLISSDLCTQPMDLPDWFYGMLMAGFTGYVGARTFEKWKT